MSQEVVQSDAERKPLSLTKFLAARRALHDRVAGEIAAVEAAEMLAFRWAHPEQFLRLVDAIVIAADEYALAACWAARESGREFLAGLDGGEAPAAAHNVVSFRGRK